jgi:hypothetical protein
VSRLALVNQGATMPALRTYRNAQIQRGSHNGH